MVKRTKLNDEWVDELVRQHKLCTPDELLAARHQASKDAVHIIDVLIEQNLVDDKALYTKIASQYGLKYVTVKPAQVMKEVVELLGEKFCRQRMIVPVKDTEDMMQILTANPLDLDLSRDLEFRFSKKVKLYLGSRRNIAAILDHVFPQEHIELDGSEVYTTDAPIEIIALTNKGPGVEPEISKLPIIRITKHILAAAIQQKAEKIYLEPVAKDVRIYFESGGIKKTIVEYPERTGSLIIKRAKFLGGIPLDQKSGPQAGRCRIKSMISHVAKNYELRVSSLPSSFGEKIIMSLFDKDEVVFPLEELGMLAQVRAYTEKLLRQDSGLLMLISPPDSGKTTSLYSSLQMLSNMKKNIYTVENSIHFTLEGITQLEVNENEGNTSPILIRSALKQNPDVLAVDDIHDALTAESVVRAAQGKTLVIATMTAESAVEAIVNLINLGVDRKTIASNLKAVIVQRLVRKICSKCKQQIAVPPVEYDLPGLMKKRGLQPKFFKGKGCDHCEQTGYHGVLGVFEVFPLTREFADAIANGSPEADLKLTAKQIGIRSLVDFSLAHVALGHTTIHEVENFINFSRLVVNNKPDPDTASKPSNFDSSNDFSKRRILVAEDNTSVRTVIKTILQTHGFIVTEAKDGRATLESLKAQRPDLLLLDINMPYLSGMDVMKHIKAHPLLQNLPIIVLTAYGQAQMEFEALESGADDYIVKPFRPELLTARIRAVLRRHEMGRVEEEAMVA